MTLTLEQIESIRQGMPIRFTPQEIGEEVVLLNAGAYQRLCDSREETEELKLQHAWQKATQKGLSLLLKDEP